jgi:tetratricopeptide (TPR) repeat protein
MYQFFFLIALLFTLGLASCGIHLNAAANPHSQAQAPLLNNLGQHHHPISTDSALAQRYFDQGLILAYGFNHAEAVRSFQQAATLDPNCAICYWGLAYVVGPNINAAMEDEAVPTAYEAIQQAIALSQAHGSDREKAYIQALAKRYSPEPMEDRAALDIAYAKAMNQVAEQYPDDLDAATLYAEALMDTMPWDYWTTSGEPKPETQQLLSVLESVLRNDPNHPGANHLYIHAVEASPHPEWGEMAADRLRSLVPGAGHLVHMPAHIYINVGRYDDAVQANLKAIAADQDYLTQCHQQGLYPVAYMPHNAHFGWSAAMLAGNRKVALDLANQTADLVDQNLLRESGYGTLQHYSVIPLYSLVKFGEWDKILAEPAPAEDLQYPMGVWHYAQGMALTRKGQIEDAKVALQKLRAIATSPALQTVTIWDINNTASLLNIGTEVLAGEIAAQENDYRSALRHLRQAVELEDNLNYDEPAPWYSPVRQTLGAILIKANRPHEAEGIYREDLERYPRNGWSLLGLAQSLEAQGKVAEAEVVYQRFKTAWQATDINLTASRL